MRIVADENMPLVRELFAPYGEVKTLPGREISAKDLREADALLVRSVTRVDRSLLADSLVRFVGSATIGTDHLDLDYLTQQGITAASAPGCNANAVAEYVIAALFALDALWLDKQVGIVGCGNVGGSLYRKLRQLGVACRCYDPFLTTPLLTTPLLTPTSIADLTSFERTLDSDIICLHTPLTLDGPFPTFHMLDATLLSALSGNRILLNAGRGAVVDNHALLQILKKGSPLQVVLDVWEPEPDMDSELLEYVQIGTPHIAGYSHEGKINGTWQVLEAFCRWQGLVAPMRSPVVPEGLLSGPFNNLCEIVHRVYDPREDHDSLVAAMEIPGSGLSAKVRGERFDNLRKHYRQRREFNFYRVTGKMPETLRNQARSLGFEVE